VGEMGKMGVVRAAVRPGPLREISMLIDTVSFEAQMTSAKAGGPTAWNHSISCPCPRPWAPTSSQIQSRDHRRILSGRKIEAEPVGSCFET